MITQDNHEDFTNCYKSTHTRAASLIRVVQSKIKLERHNFSKFIKVLEKNKRYYSSILKKLYSHDMDSPPMYSQHHVCEDSPNESDEAGALLHGRVPYVQYEDDCQCRKPERQYTCSLPTCNTVCVFCIDKVVYPCVDFAAKRPLKSMLVQFVIGFLLLIMMGQLIVNFTSEYDLYLIVMLFIGFFFNSMCICFCCFVICDV